MTRVLSLLLDRRDPHFGPRRRGAAPELDGPIPPAPGEGAGGTDEPSEPAPSEPAPIDEAPEQAVPEPPQAGGQLGAPTPHFGEAPPFPPGYGVEPLPGALPTPTQAINRLRQQPETPGVLGVLELALFQAQMGAWLGGALCALASRDCEVAAIPSAIGGSLVGAGVSVLGARRGITAGHAATVNEGVLWGAGVGYALHTAISYRDGSYVEDIRPILGSMIAGGIVGGLTGELLFRAIRPEAGEVAMGRTLTRYMVTWLALGAAAGDVDSDGAFRAVHALSIAAVPLGFALGGHLGAKLKMSRNRVRLIEAFALAGGGLGALPTAFIRDANEDTLFVGILVGSALGLGAGIAISEVIALRRDRAVLSLAPSQGGALASFSLELR